MRTDTNESAFNEDVKQQINNLTYHADLLDSSSFVESRNDKHLNKYEQMASRATYQEMNIFPVVNAPTMEFTTQDIRPHEPPQDEESFCHAESEMLEEEDRHRNDDSIEEAVTGTFDLQVKHRRLKEAYVVLQQRLSKMEKKQALEAIGAEKRRGSPSGRITEELKEKDRKNIELHRQVKQLMEQNRHLKEENDKKARQLAGKIAQLKREHQRYEQLLSRLKQQQMTTEASIASQVRSKDVQIKRLKNQVVLLNSTLSELKDETARTRQDQARQMEDSKRLRASNRQLLEKLKAEMHRTQQTSIRNSAVSSNTSLMESFSPEMLSPEETIELIYQVFKRVSRSSRMQRILYQNHEFVELLRYFTQEAARC